MPFTESKRSGGFKTSKKSSHAFSTPVNSNPSVPFNGSKSAKPTNATANNSTPSLRESNHFKPCLNKSIQQTPFVESNHHASKINSLAEERIPSIPNQTASSVFNSSKGIFGENKPRDDRDRKITKLTHDNLKQDQKIKALLKKNPDMDQFRVRNETEEHCYQRSIETLIFYNNSVPKKIKTGNCRMLFKSLTSLHKIAVQWGYIYQLRTFTQYLGKQGINYVEPKDAIEQRRDIVETYPCLIRNSPGILNFNVFCRQGEKDFFLDPYPFQLPR